MTKDWIIKRIHKIIFLTLGMLTLEQIIYILLIMRVSRGKDLHTKSNITNPALPANLNKMQILVQRLVKLRISF